MHNLNEPWWNDAVFYHIFPLGLCGCPKRNDFRSDVIHRIEKLNQWWPHLHWLGVNAVYLGPLLESSTHGYDTADFLHVDRRLGDWKTLQNVLAEGRRHGLRFIIDGVFHHVGRDFWAFRDVQQRGASSQYAQWFAGLNFDQRSPCGDPFAYEGWEGHFDLVKLNLRHPDVREHIFSAVRQWIEQLDLDGLRLDVAYLLDSEFLVDLARHCRGLKRGFWLLGEMIHGDYRTWVQEGKLDSGTNYECFKGLYSSHNDVNYFEIAYSLKRLFGDAGLYRALVLYNFADNHDVDRIASLLKKSEHLYPLHILLFSIPGIPSVYCGSEWGVPGKKTKGDDWGLRPSLDLDTASSTLEHRDLAETIHRLSEARRLAPALRRGDYRQLHLTHQQLAFTRRYQEDQVIVAVNSAPKPVGLELKVDEHFDGTYRDLLNSERQYRSVKGRLYLPIVDPNWGCLLQLER